MRRFVCLLAAFAAGCGSSSSPSPVPAAKGMAPPVIPAPAPPANPAVPVLGPPPTSTEKPIEITVEDLVAEKKKDLAAAKAKYHDKQLLVTGVVSFVQGKTFTRPGYMVLLKYPGMSTDLEKRSKEGFFCHLWNDPVAGKLAIGQTVKVQGGCNIYGPALGASKLVEAGPDTAVRATAEAFAKGLEADPAAAAKQNADKTVVLTGKIKSVDKGPMDLVKVVFATGSEAKFELAAEMYAETKLDKLKWTPGQEVTVAAVFGGYNAAAKRIELRYGLPPD